MTSHGPGLRKAAAAGILVGAILSVGELGTQDTWPPRGEVYGSIGAGRFYHGDNYWGSGTQLGGGLGLRPFPGALRRLGLEVRANRLGFSRTPGGPYSSTGDAVSVAGGILWHFTDSIAQPYVLTELGVMRTSFTLKGIADWYDANPDGTLGQHHVEPWTQQDEASQFLFGLGAGMKIRLRQRLYVRPELRFDTTTPGRGWNFGTLRVSIGCGYYW